MLNIDQKWCDEMETLGVNLLLLGLRTKSISELKKGAEAMGRGKKGRKIYGMWVCLKVNLAESASRSNYREGFFLCATPRFSRTCFFLPSR